MRERANSHFIQLVAKWSALAWQRRQQHSELNWTEGGEQHNACDRQKLRGKREEQRQRAYVRNRHLIIFVRPFCSMRKLTRVRTHTFSAYDGLPQCSADSHVVHTILCKYSSAYGGPLHPHSLYTDARSCGTRAAPGRRPNRALNN